GVELLTQLQQVEGTVVSEEEGILALAGKPVYFNPFIMSELARLGLWDQTPVVSLLEQGQAPVVILRELPNPDRARDSGTGAGWNRFTPEMERALANRYRPLLVVPFRREWIVMVPR
ncbi:MAG TPA: hypothetical protein VEI97_05565, partial [bacterium]|nr:hypothetical protein [bacterium]